MNTIELSAMSLPELLALRNTIDAEITSRGHSRTASSLAGELKEQVVSVAYGGELVQVGARSESCGRPLERALVDRTGGPLTSRE